MANPSFSDQVRELLKIARSYAKTRIELMRLSLLEKAALAGAFFLSSVIIVLIVAFCFLFISLAFAFWYGQLTGNLAGGFLILTGFYLVVGLVFVISRRYLVLRPVIKAMSTIIYSNDDNESEETSKDEKQV